MKVIKRDGRAVDYDSNKIKIAINKANNEVSSEEKATKKQIDGIIKYIESLNKKRILVEDIQDIIEQKLMGLKKYTLAKKYIIYRYNRALVRKSNLTDETILSSIKNNSKNISFNEPSIKYTSNQFHLIATEVSKDITKRILLPSKISNAVLDGKIFFHDSSYFITPMFQTGFIRLYEMLDKGVKIGSIHYDRPKSFNDACFISSLILLDASSSMYGNVLINLLDLEPFYDNKDINKGIKMFFDILESLKNANGISPTFDFYLEKSSDLSKDFLKCYLNLLEDDCRPNFRFIVSTLDIDSDLDYLKILSKVSILGNVTYLSDKKSNELFSSISPPLDECFLNSKGKEDVRGKFIIGKVSINLLDLYISYILNDNNFEGFYKALEERLDLCKEALMVRYYSILGTFSNTYPILYKEGGIYEFKDDEKIDLLLKDYKSCLVVSYPTLCMFDLDFSYKLLKRIKKYVSTWEKELGVLFRVKKDTLENDYFVSKNNERFGVIKGVTDYTLENISVKSDTFIDTVQKYQKYLEISPDGLVLNVKDVDFEITKLQELIKYLSENVLMFSLNK